MISLSSRLIIVLSVFVTSILSAQTVSSVVPSTLATGIAIVPHDDPYYKYQLKDRDVEIIYTEENIPFAKHTADMEDALHNDYEEFYNWKLDETLHVGLISNCNQVAHGFSTQWPNNRQIKYIGGTILVDYFTNTSWLDVLIYHETAHNYQVNTKGGKASQWLHSVFGNGSVMVPLPFIIPNSVENSFMLEGNAVLNESWHGGGGRLYSGRFKAMMLLQAKAGDITPELMYNKNINFPYGGDIYYQIGGFYNLYLAQKYGLKKVNSYFNAKSKDWVWPFYTNNSMQLTVGSDFETTLSEFASYYAKEAENLVLAKGDTIASTQFYSSISSDKDEIFFVTNESGYKIPELVVVNKQSMKVTKDRDSWMAQKVIKVDGEYFTQGGTNTSPIKITQGLFDNNGFLKEGTGSKMIQGYLSGGRAVYFDVQSSYDFPQLYVGDKYYGYANSSVFIDKNDNLYYFANKEKGKERTLYKNKTPLFTYQGFYGIVSDVDSKGAVYFIASSELGSTLYRYYDGKITRASDADNILEARLINDAEVLLSAVSEKDYYYVKNDLVSIEQKPYETKLFFEDKPYYKQYKVDGTSAHKHDSIDTSNDYYSMLNLNYSGSDFTFGLTPEKDIVGSLSINFGDPLSQNSANVFIIRDDTNITIAGAGYRNSQYIVEYALNAYGVIDNNDRNDTRDYGITASAALPFYKAGYYEGSFGATYFQDFDTDEREPLTGSISFGRFESYGKSMYANYTNALVLYGVKERDDAISGGAYQFSHELIYESYFKFEGKYSLTNSEVTDAVAQNDTRGVKLSESVFELDMDISTVSMPTLDDSLYLKAAGYGEVGLSSVINLSSYWFTFPLSLQREAVYAKYRYYDLEYFNSEHENVSEVMAGLRFDVVALNILTLALSFDYYYNDTENELITKDNSQFRFTMGSSF